MPVGNGPDAGLSAVALSEERPHTAERILVALSAPHDGHTGALAEAFTSSSKRQPQAPHWYSYNGILSSRWSQSTA
jgi:hypothetical protein